LKSKSIKIKVSFFLLVPQIPRLTNCSFLFPDDNLLDKAIKVEPINVLYFLFTD